VLRAGSYRYIVTPMFWHTSPDDLERGAAQEAELDLMRTTLPGQLDIGFTRGFISSQAFVSRYGGQAAVAELVAPVSLGGLDFVPTHPKADEALPWMGFEARRLVLGFLKKAVEAGAEVSAIAYDLNLPEIVDLFEQIGPRLRIIIDDSAHHKDPEAPESIAAARLVAKGAQVKRQHMSNLQHHKSIAVSGGGMNHVLLGSTNYTWRGFYVQSNNALIVEGAAAVGRYLEAFDVYFAAKRGADFRKHPVAVGWHDLGVNGLDAQIAWSPHPADGGVLVDVANTILGAQSSVLFSLAFLGQTKKGAVGPALGKVIADGNAHVIGIADARVNAGNIGVTVMSPDAKRRIVRAAALINNVPEPFNSEPTSLAGVDGTARGTRMHHKFVVVDFDRPEACVYLGSYNFSVPADQENGENLVVIRDRTVATSYMVEAVRIYDHYRFRVARADAQPTPGQQPKPITLRLPPANPTEKPWFWRDWNDPVRIRDREMFA
jgi:hypothetical protein